MKKVNTKQGFIGWILLIIIAIAVLSYFGFNFQAFFNSPTVQQNFSFVWTWVLYVWNNFLAVPFAFIWGMIEKFIIQPLIQIAAMKAIGQ